MSKLSERLRDSEWTYVDAQDRKEIADALDAMEAALRFYANPRIYQPHPHGPHFDEPDKSFAARAALEKLEGGK